MVMKWHVLTNKIVQNFLAFFVIMLYFKASNVIVFVRTLSNIESKRSVK